MSKSSKTDKATKTDKAANQAATEKRNAEQLAKERALWAEIVSLTKLVHAQVTKLVNDVNARETVQSNTYTIAKDNLAALVTLFNKFSVYLPKEEAANARATAAAKNDARKNSTTVREKAKTEKTAKAAQSEDDADMPDDDGPEDDGDEFDEGV